MFVACFKQFTRGLDTNANTVSRMLMHSWPDLPGFVKRLMLPCTPVVGRVK